MSSVPHSRSRRSRYTLLAEAVLGVWMVFLPLALGSAPAWVLWPLVGLAGLAFGLACVGARRQHQSLHLPWLAVPLGAGALLCLLQLVPLPPGLLAVLSPEAEAVRGHVLVPLGLDGARPLSLDTPATWRELSKHLAYLLGFLAAVQVCRSSRARRRLLSVLAATGAAVVLLGLLHELLGLTELLGVVAFVHARPPLITPFGNPNHLAAFLTLASTVALGLALSSGTRMRAAPFAVAAVLSGAGVLLSLSRGGIAFFVFGQLAFALLLVFGRKGTKGRAEPWRRGGAVLVCLLAVLAVGGYVAFERITGELATADSVEKLRHSKLELWPVLVSTARAFPLGMGRGAFEAAFPRYQTQRSVNTFTHPENAVLQLAIEFGVPGVLLLAVALGGFVLLARREGLGALELSVLAGVAALGLHDLFDFSLELTASAVAALVALATVARPLDRERSEAPRGQAPMFALAVGGVLSCVALAALVPARHSLSAAEEALGKQVAARAPLAQVRARGLVLIAEHPADYALQDLLGMASAEAGPSGAAEALGFANRALFLNPLDARAHRVAARALLTLGRRTQAFLEYRLAFEAGDSEVLWREALGRARTLEELQALTPESVRDAVQLVTELMRAGRQAEALSWLAWARERFDAEPGVAGLWEREARLRLDRHELELAEAASAEVSRRAPEVLSSHLLRAEVLRARGRNEEALHFLATLLTRFPDDVELAFMLAQSRIDLGQTRLARETLRQVNPFVSDLSQRARLFALEGASYEKDGRRARALESWRSAVRIQPDANLWFKVASLHEELRHFDAAALAVREGLRLLPPERRAEGEAWVARLEGAEHQLDEGSRRQREAHPGDEDLLLQVIGPDETTGLDEEP